MTDSVIVTTEQVTLLTETESVTLIVSESQGPPGITGATGATGAQGAQGIQGLQGAPGPNSIGGFNLQIQQEMLLPGDTIEFTGLGWTNTSKLNLTDGGNF